MFDHRGRARGISKLEERRADFLRSFTFDDVSQLDQGTSTASADIREWRNSFLPINRVPLDILSLIPTHLSSQQDRIRATLVCRHWRRTFLQHAALWSHLRLSKGEAYVKTLLERAKGSALYITTSWKNIGTIPLFRPLTAQIKYLSFEHNIWGEIQAFSEVVSGPLPLLHTLKINAVDEWDLRLPNVMTPPSLPLFTGAINLKELALHSERSPFLRHFVFPNLTKLELSAKPSGEGFRASQLLDFLEASPTLQTVHVKITDDVLLDDFPHERVVVLPNVEAFALNVYEGWGCYEIAARIACPSVRNTSFAYERDIPSATVLQFPTFPTTVSWNTIVRQFTRSPVEEVGLDISFSRNPVITCSITFLSSDKTVLRLKFQVNESGEEEEELQMSFQEMHAQVFHQASRTIRNHPLLENIKRLDICHMAVVVDSDQFLRLSEDVERLYKFVGPLEEFSASCLDLNLYFGPFPEPPESLGPTALPPIKRLEISHPSFRPGKEECMAAIVELARSRHALGIPFELITVRMERLPKAMAERLGPWVGAAECYEDLDPINFI